MRLLRLLLWLVRDWCRSRSDADETGSCEVRDLNSSSLRDSGTLLALGFFFFLALGATASALLRLFGVADGLSRIEVGRRMLDEKMRESICVGVASQHLLLGRTEIAEGGGKISPLNGTSAILPTSR